MRGNNMYCDSRAGKWPVESVIIKDLIPHIDATYRIAAFRLNTMGDAPFTFFGSSPAKAPQGSPKT